MARAAFFCDINKNALIELRTRLTNPSWQWSSYLMPGDNEEAIEVFAETIRR